MLIKKKLDRTGTLSTYYKKEIIELKDKLGRVPKLTEWIKQYHHSASALNRIGFNWETMVKDLGNVSLKEVSVEAEKTEDSDNVQLDEWIGILKKYQQLDNKFDSNTNYVSCDYTNVKHPMILMFTADWHFGSRLCNYQKWYNDFLFIKKIPADRLRLMLIGDLIDNVYPSFKSAESVFGYLRPELQKKLLTTILTNIKPYLEVLAWGNHEVEWDEKRIGYSDLADMFGTLCHYFYGKGHVNFKLGEQQYKLLLTHKMRGKSSLHSFGACLKGWAETHADIIACAHTHDPGYMTDYFGLNETDGQPKERHLVQLGTYQTGKNSYSDRYFKPGVSINPCLVLYPDTYKIMYFSTLEDAAKWLGIVTNISEG